MLLPEQDDLTTWEPDFRRALYYVAPDRVNCFWPSAGQLITGEALYNNVNNLSSEGTGSSIRGRWRVDWGV